MRKLTDFEQVLKEFGGLKGLAEFFGVPVEVVRHWTKWERFPAKTYAVMNAELTRRGKAAPIDLWGMLEHAN